MEFKVFILSKRVVSALVAYLLFSATLHAKLSAVEFQDQAAEIMLATLKEHPQKGFLNRLYERLLYVPVWVNHKGQTKFSKELFDLILSDVTLEKEMKLYQDALRLKEMAQQLNEDTTIEKKLELEFKISQLYEGYATYSIYGSINWGAFLARLWNKKTDDVHADWIIHKPFIGPIDLLEVAVLEGSLKKAFEKATPKRYRYKELQKELGRYIRIKERGGWPTVVTEAKKLTPGMKDKGVPALRKRLSVTKDYRPAPDQNLSSPLYDKALVAAVKHFQKRTGLAVDGVVGPGTLRELNKSVEDRILTLRLNLDRIKWLRDLQKPYHIVINIPDFMLYFLKDGKPIEKIRVVVGKKHHPTPIFSDIVETIVINPYWNVPKRIAQNELVPKLMRNPHALKRKNIKIFNGWGANAKEIDPATVNWAKYRYSTHFPFRFAQLPGKNNALGRVKFLFPNEFSVYMHDTPAKSLFARNKRAYSHGCVRLAKPIKLLEHFSAIDPALTFKKAKRILNNKKRHFVALKRKIPVDIVYLTAFIDFEDRTLQFRQDVYDYDKMQLKAYRGW